MESWTLNNEHSENAVDFCKFGPISFVWLKGHPQRRMRSYCRLIEHGFVSRRVVQFYGQKLLHNLQGKPIEPVVKHTLDFVNYFFLKTLPHELKEELKELEDIFGPQLIRRAVRLPDIGSSVNALRSLDFIKPYIPELGCTSAAKFIDGEMIYGRNLDFVGTELFDQHPSVVVHLPESKEEYKHAAFTADGLPWASITGVNECGISLALHQNFSDVKSNGVPAIAIGELIMREANNLDRAIAIIDQYKPGPMWTFVLCDLNKQRVISVEASGLGLSIREMESDQFVQTNHLLVERDREFSPPATHYNSVFRRNRAETLLNDVDGVEAMIKLLGDHSDPAGDMAMYHDILKPSTLHSLVLKKSGDDIQVAFSGDRAPACTGRFASFSLNQLWQGLQGFEATSINSFVNQKVRKKQVNSGVAYAAYFDNEDYEKTIELVADQSSITARAISATCYYKLERFGEALAVCDELLQQENDLAENFHIIKLLSLLRLGRVADARDWADQIEKPRVTKLIELISKIKNDEEVENYQLFFNFFAGQVYSPPEKTI